ncbi:hypothetical protein H9P43_005105 [Blastocladiella emersonii ATCC 22665]|nr:hypothetical protein H9P43_005105 [Blastocladiella emersonii ATCC 22665]
MDLPSTDYWLNLVTNFAPHGDGFGVDRRRVEYFNFYLYPAASVPSSLESSPFLQDTLTEFASSGGTSLRSTILPKLVAFLRVVFEISADPNMQLLAIGDTAMDDVHGVVLPHRLVRFPPAGPGLAPTPTAECLVAILDRNHPDFIVLNQAQRQLDPLTTPTYDVTALVCLEDISLMLSLAKVKGPAVPALDPRFPPEIYARLRPHLKSVVLFPYFPIA